MNNTLTEFGAQVRKYRIDVNARLKTMAEELGVSSAYLSAVETGRKRLTTDLVEKSIQFFEKRGIAASDLRALASRSVKKIDLDEFDDRSRSAVLAFARTFPSWSDAERKVFEDLMKKYNLK